LTIAAEVRGATSKLSSIPRAAFAIIVQGTGDVFLDFWNGQQDLTTDAVQLTATPQTFTLQAQVPATADTHLQVRTATTGPVDLYASAASIQLQTPEGGSG
jgi:hypothetical protein